MADEPQLNEDDKPILNTFGLPALCETENPARECCSPCSDWIFCLQRSPIEMNLTGFDFSRWLPCVSMSAHKVLHASGVFTGDDGADPTSIFEGTFLALTANATLTNGDCGSRGLVDRCQDLFYDDGLGQNAYPLTHTTSQGRTVYAPDAYLSPSKHYYVDLNVVCVENGEGEQCVKFEVVLHFEFERLETIGVGCVSEYVPGVNGCDYGSVSAIDNLLIEGETPGHIFFNEGESHIQERGCCVLMQSECIPLEGLTWADLDNIELTSTNMGVCDWELSDEEDPESSWGCPDDFLNQIPCLGRSFGKFKSIPYSVGADCDEYEACGGVLPGTTPITGVHDPFNAGCPHPAEGGATVWTMFGGNGVWIPPPITGGEGSFLRVLPSSCDRVPNCSTCETDNHIALPVVFDFTWVGTGCNKFFTPRITSCVNVVKVYWSWGEVTDGLEGISHTIANLGEDGFTKTEDITAIAVDDRGCIYCYKETIICGCCPGASGSLSIVSTGLNEYELCAFTDMPGEGPCEGQPSEISWFGSGTDPSSGVLANGTCQTIELIGETPPTITWRVIDANDCAGDEVTVDLHRVVCNCCEQPLNAVYLTIENWSPGFPDPFADCSGTCDEMNTTFELVPSHDTDSCDWQYQTTVGDGPPFFCGSYGDPPSEVYSHVEILLRFECVGDGKTRVWASITNGGGFGFYYKEITCTGCGPGDENNCEGLSGELTLDSLGLIGSPPSVGQCDPLPATVTLNLVFGA